MSRALPNFKHDFTSSSKDLLCHEKLAQAVKQFRCLHDKSLKHYKRQHKRNNAWTKVAELADMEQSICIL